MRETLRARAHITKEIRNWFHARDFLELETPLLLPAPDREPTLQFLTTEIKTPVGPRTAYLATSPEYNHKKLLGKGIYNTFEITRSFRDGESWGGIHNPEFTILEWYRTPADYTALMDDCEELIAHIQRVILEGARRATDRIQPKTPGFYRPATQGSRMTQGNAWPRLTIIELFKQYCDTDITAFTDADWRALPTRLGITSDPSDTLSDIFYRIFLTRVEPELAKLETPVFVLDYPVFQASLAKRKKENPRFVERFELYAGGLELANAFSELLDAQEQRSRLVEQGTYRKEHNLPVPPLDEQFLKALNAPIPPTAGIALGVDRLVMWLLGLDKIESVLPLPAAELFDSN